MNKKNEKKLCWNCEGNVSHHIAQCPYCGVDLTQPAALGNNPFKGFGSSLQNKVQQEIPHPPYSQVEKQDLAVTKEEWDAALREETGGQKAEDDELPPSTKKEMVALLLLMPGVIFFLFGMALFLFSSNGVFTLSWNQHFAYFYLLGAAPLLYLGWRAFRR